MARISDGTSWAKKVERFISDIYDQSLKSNMLFNVNCAHDRDGMLCYSECHAEQHIGIVGTCVPNGTCYLLRGLTQDSAIKDAGRDFMKR